MLSAATLVILAALVLNANRLIIEGEKDIVKGEASDAAVNYAQSLLTEIGRKKFDANSKDSVYQTTSEFTAASSLGPSSSELSQINPWPDRYPFKSIKAYSDADDYNDYVRTVDTDIAKGFRLSVKVYYVKSSAPNTKVTSKEYFKKVDVSVEQCNKSTCTFNGGPDAHIAEPLAGAHPGYLKKSTFSTLVTN